MVLEDMHSWQFFVTFFGWLSDPFKGLSDLQLGDEKVTLNHLAFLFWTKRLHLFRCKIIKIPVSFWEVQGIATAGLCHL